MRDQVAIVSEVLGRAYSVQETSQAEAATAVFPEGTPDVVATSVLETMGPGAAVVTPSDDVAALTGRTARPFSAWVADNAAAFA